MSDGTDPRLQRVNDALDDARRQLIDISRRNRLLHTPRTGRRIHCLEFNVDPDAVFGDLAREGKAFAFRAEENDDNEATAEGRSRALPVLGARVTSEVLDRRLLKFFREARNIEEEQGVNILFLAFGFLKWFEDPRSSEPCWAPLILLPVLIERRQGREQFVLRGRDDDLMVNVSLREKLRSISQVELPELPEEDSWLPSAYLDAVTTAISGETRWQVDRTGCGLGFFTFSKFLMWRDLAAPAWPEASRLLAHPLVSSLLGHAQGFDPAPPIAEDDEPIDKKGGSCLRRGQLPGTRHRGGESWAKPCDPRSAGDRQISDYREHYRHGSAQRSVGPIRCGEGRRARRSSQPAQSCGP